MTEATINESVIYYREENAMLRKRCDRLQQLIDIERQANEDLQMQLDAAGEDGARSVESELDAALMDVVDKFNRRAYNLD